MPRDWQGVPPEHIARWNEVFSRAAPTLRLSEACPVCGERALRRYFLEGRPIDRTLDGVRYRSRGASWEWCGSCRAYEHASALVPEAWTCDLDVDTSALTAEPEALEVALRIPGR
ncbi:hypothetical protein LZ198_09965 [Myxococcus sp. K15C18031901]|uniref:hypothetical protein n=1 Tax=Myxococcus dinghuensis TaxID=2906761 RepID=UPI0020A74E25|nr:hypothetical protein [Myxococcus dinghuensis]MCP3099194.1 hypothetical protein [Myxococcus dinghuensis]